MVPTHTPESFRILQFISSVNNKAKPLKYSCDSPMLNISFTSINGLLCSAWDTLKNNNNNTLNYQMIILSNYQIVNIWILIKYK